MNTAQNVAELNTEDRQAVIDDEHLRLLSIFHYISGGLTVMFALFCGVWMTFMGFMFSFLPEPPHLAAQSPQRPPAVIFVIFGFLFVLGIAYGVLEILAGRWISLRRRRLLTVIVQLPRVMFLPYGVILTVFTLLVLERPGVKALFRA